MSRLSLLVLLAAPLLAACDSSEPGDDLVGVWTVSSVQTEYVVTSRTAQTLPDLSASPSGAVTVTGDASARFDRLGFVFSDGMGTSILSLTTSTATGTGSDPDLMIFQSEADSEVRFLDGPSGRYFTGTFPGQTSFGVSGTTLSVPARSLGDGAGAVVVRGSLTFPGIALAAGQPTAVPSGTLDIVGEATTFEFGDDGGFTVTTRYGNESEVSSGTWKVRDDGRLRIGIVDGTTTETNVFAYEISGGTLRLSASGLDNSASCDAECRRQIEAQIFAAPGSLSALDTNAIITLRSGRPSASVRVAPEGTRPARPLPPTVPILGRR